MKRFLAALAVCGILLSLDSAPATEEDAMAKKKKYDWWVNSTNGNGFSGTVDSDEVTVDNTDITVDQTP